MTRYAPSPTGLLHLGHVANAVWTWGVARALGGRVLLRLEDHDRGRCRPEYERELLKDLAWLGFEPDNGPCASFAAHPHPFRQSDAEATYQEVLDRLSSTGLIYGCRCSRRIIAERGGPVGEGEEQVYPGTCRDLGLPPAPPYAARMHVPDETVPVVDLLRGHGLQRPAAQCGDFVIRDALGRWTYQFAVVVDDFRQGVNLVIRGEDILESTGRQILLSRQLGRDPPPVWLHHPLIRNAAGVKLSKRDRATGVQDLLMAGTSAATVIGMAAYRTGLLVAPEPVEARDVAGLFTPLSVGKDARSD